MSRSKTLDAYRAMKLKKLDADVVDLTTRTDEMTQEVNDNSQNLAAIAEQVTDFSADKSNYVPRVPTVVFVSDDGVVTDYTYFKAMAIKYSVPFCMAIITGSIGQNVSGYDHMTLEQMKELVNVYGCETLSHTHSHVDLSSASAAIVESEMIASRDVLKANGLPHKGIVYPQGGNNATVRSLASKYYRYGVIVQDGTGNVKINNNCVPAFYIVRCNLGAYFDTFVNGIPATNTYDYYKYCVDLAITNNALLVFEMHTWHSDFDATQRQYFDDIIAYIKTTSARIVTMDTAMQMFENAYESGDFLGIWNNSGWAINKLGQYQSRLPQYTSTAGRNGLTGTVRGDMVFDTTLNKPVWRNAYNTGWVDAAGNTV